jgi:hypothetical protein
MPTIMHRLVGQHPLVQKLFYLTGRRKPALPTELGMKFYQKHSSWPLDLETCTCDLEFVEYLKQSKIQGKSIFHFGTGVHHLVGIENQQLSQPNEVIGITASEPEHKSYVELILKDSTLAKFYKVIFADIYTLTSKTIPNLDVIALFHLCEFYLPENAPLVHQNDKTLLELFISKLNPDGKLLFYTGSRAWDDAQPIVKALETAGKIRQIGKYKQLLIYTKVL